MTPNPSLTARVDPAIVARVEACVDARNAAAEPGAPPFDRGAIVRLLILRGLPDLEAELGIAPAKGRKGGAKPARKPKP
ncbi:MAG: hypothetical protein U0359_01100 [Byssovorax sp.]